MRLGRLRIEAERRTMNARYLVVPDDGSEPIELRVNQCFLSARAMQAATAIVRVYVDSFEIADFEGNAVRADGGGAGKPVIYTQVEFDPPGGGTIEAFSWRHRAGDLHGPIRVKHLDLPRVPA